VKAGFIGLGTAGADMAAGLQTASRAERHTVPVEFGEVADGESGGEIKVDPQPLTEALANQAKNG